MTELADDSLSKMPIVLFARVDLYHKERALRMEESADAQQLP
jgi:hypothetical protein